MNDSTGFHPGPFYISTLLAANKLKQQKQSMKIENSA